MKLTVFLSVAGAEGLKVGSALKKRLETIKDKSGVEFRCFLYSEEQFAGDTLIQSYIETLERSAFFVPVLTEEYCDPKRGHVENELRLALDRDQEIFAMHRARFIFPYAPTRGKALLSRIPVLRGKIFAENADTLVKSFVKNSPLALLTKADRPLGFQTDWPRSFFNQKGDPDILLVLGHSGKESVPTAPEIRNLQIPTMEEDLATRYVDSAPDSPHPTLPTQSMRIAEYLPRLIHFLSNQYLSINPKAKEVPRFVADIDWHLIKYRKELLGSHNLVCFGAGDTNWISRAVLAFYGSFLPIVFDHPGGSHVIYYRPKAEVPPDSGGKEDKSGKIEVAKYAASITQVTAYDRQFSAVLLLLPNPWNPDKRVVIAAGLNALGSQAAVLALCEPTLLGAGNNGVPWARVIRGREGDGNRAYQAIGFDVVS